MTLYVLYFDWRYEYIGRKDVVLIAIISFLGVKVRAFQGARAVTEPDGKYANRYSAAKRN